MCDAECQTEQETHSNEESQIIREQDCGENNVHETNGREDVSYKPKVTRALV